jgi:predicted ribosomally synthesized peptide with SipW-like signal peptide
MKNILISFALVLGVVAVVAGATRAYFTDTGVVEGNTFSTGTVKLGDFGTQAITVTNLAPGKWSDWKTLQVPYIGSLNADLYAGVGGCLGTDDDDYIADVLQMQLRRYPSEEWVWGGYTEYLSTNWLKVATNITYGNHWYMMRFMLDADVGNEYQEVSNTDTRIIIHAVQAGEVDFPYVEPWELVNSADPVYWTCP